MFGQRKVTCAICRVQVLRKEALRGYDRKDVAICRTCHEQWDRAGGSAQGARPRSGALRRSESFLTVAPWVMRIAARFG
jgi:hypothetical protein